MKVINLFINFGESIQYELFKGDGLLEYMNDQVEDTYTEIDEMFHFYSDKDKIHEFPIESIDPDKYYKLEYIGNKWSSGFDEYISEVSKDIYDNAEKIEELNHKQYKKAKEKFILEREKIFKELQDTIF